MNSFLDVARARSHGIYGAFETINELYIPDAANSSRFVLDTNRVMMNMSDLWSFLANIPRFQENASVGYGGLGIDFYAFYALSPVVLWFLAIIAVRYICREPFARLGMCLGVVTEDSTKYCQRLAQGKRGTGALSPANQRKLFKFQNQVWLTVFYIVSSIFGYYIQYDKPWFKFPLTEDAALNILVPHPQIPTPEILLYYHYELAFYLAEICSLLIIERSVKRSDFLEYVIHHVSTIFLIVNSHLGWEHRYGAYVLFLHDTSDIMLSLSKSIHYMVSEDAARAKRYNTVHKALRDGKTYKPHFIFKHIFTETTTNIGFGLFIASFAFMRLYCLPKITIASVFMSARIRHGTINYWLLAFFLNVVLQSLHIYWGILIVKMVYSLIFSDTRKDIRSDCDECDEKPDLIVWGSDNSQFAVNSYLSAYGKVEMEDSINGVVVCSSETLQENCDGDGVVIEEEEEQLENEHIEGL